MKKLIPLLSLFCFHLLIYAQPLSFTQKLEGDYFLFDASVNETDDIYIVLDSIASPHWVKVVKYDPHSDSSQVTFEFNQLPLTEHRGLSDYRLIKGTRKNAFYFLFDEAPGFCPTPLYYIDLDTKEYWSLCFFYSTLTFQSGIDIDDRGFSHFFINGEIGSGNDPPSPAGIYYMKITSKGKLNDVKKFNFSGTGRYYVERKVVPRDLLYLPATQKLAIIGRLDSEYSFLLKADTSGQFFEAINFKDIDLYQLIYDKEGGFYALGSTQLKADLSENKVDLVLLKFNAAFELQWSKVYYADNFDFKKATMEVLPDSSLALVYSTKGAFPVILAKLYSSGDIRWQKGYALYEPFINVFSDGSLLLCTREHFDVAGNTFQQTIIAKTDTLGNIDGCDVFPTCLKSTDVNIIAGTFTMSEQMANPKFDTTELVFRDSVVRFTDFCDIPPSPSPEFVLPDTVCVGACIEATDLNNHFAHGVVWELEGENLHEIRPDSLEFRQCFSQPGAYTVRQRVWFLGCAYEYEKTLTVLDELRLSFDLEKEILCQLPPAQVKVKGNRPLSDVAWNTGASGETIFPITGGQYRATATDGYCQATDSFQIAFLNELISPEEALHLPADTVVCEAHLPFVLRPESSVATDFTLENQNGRQFDLRESGRYTVRAEVYGCPVEKSFELKTDRCAAKIYLPTTFSPNGDGINDDFVPQGKDFLTLELLIFDRWGGLIHRSEGATAGWNGKTTSGASAPLGVYSFKLTYLNTLLNKQEEVQGDVTVLR